MKQENLKVEGSEHELNITLNSDVKYKRLFLLLILPTTTGKVKAEHI